MNKLELLDQIRNCLAQEASSIGILLEKYGDLPLKEIAKIALGEQKPISSALKNAILKTASRLYDADTANEVSSHLDQNIVFNTAEHFGYSKGFFLQSNIFTACMEKFRSHKFNIVLACSNISFRDPSRPSTIDWKGESTNLVSVKNSKCTLYSAPPIDEARWMNIPEDFRNLISYEELPTSGFMDQMGQINSTLWEKSFCQDPAFPKLIYLSLEEIATQLIIESINRKDRVFRFCFDPENIKFMIDTFEGLPYCWQQQNKGTHLFWYNIFHKSKYPLRFDGKESLTYKDFKLQLNSDEIIEKLTDKTIIPGLFLCHLILLHHNARVLGGPMQILAMPDIWRRWCKVNQLDTHDSVTNESQMSMFPLLFNKEFNPLNFDDLIELPIEKQHIMFDQMEQVYENLTPKDMMSLFAFPAIINQKKNPHPFIQLLEYGDPKIISNLLELDSRLKLRL